MTNTETMPELLIRKLKEIQDLIEIGKNSNSILGWEIKDCPINHNGLSVPAITITVSFNESLVKGW